MDDLLHSYVDGFPVFAEHIDLTKFEPTDQPSVPPPPQCASLAAYQQAWVNPDETSATSSKGVRFDLADLLPKDPNHPYNKGQSRVKRPMNSFMLFSNEMRPVLQDQNKALTNNDISKMLGQMWKDMPYDQKRPYLERALEIKSQFNACHPDYTYTKSPRKRQKINKLRKFTPMDGALKQELSEAPSSVVFAAAAAAAAATPVQFDTAAVFVPPPVALTAVGEKQPLSPELIRSVVNQVSIDLELSSHDPRVCVLL